MKTSFRQRQFIVLLVFALVPLLFALGIALPSARRVGRQRALEQLNVVANLLGVQFDTEIAETHHVAEVLSSQSLPRRAIAAYLANPSSRTETEVQQLLQNSLETHKDISGISLLSPATGEIIFSTFTEKDRHRYNNIDETLKTVQTTGNIAFTIAYAADGSPPQLVAFAPIRTDDGTLVSVASVCTDLDEIATNLQASAAELETGRVYLIDTAGRLLSTPPNLAAGQRYTIAHSDAISHLLAGKSGSGAYYDIQKTPVFGAYRWLPQLQVGMIVETDAALMTASLDDMLLWSLGLVLLMMVLAVFFARRLNRWLTTPLTQLTAAVQVFQQGDLSFRIPASDTNDEFARVATAFNRMADKLETLYGTMAQQVHDRTIELRATNNRLRQEIADRVRAEEELRYSEQKFRTAFRTGPDPVTISRIVDGYFLDVNAAYSRVTGYSAAETLGKTSAELRLWRHPEDRQQLIEQLQRDGEVDNVECEFRRKDDSTFIGLVSARIMVINNELYWVMITRDISYLKRTEQALKESETRYRSIFEDSPVSLWEEDFSPVKAYLESLRADGITDIPAFLRDNLEVVEICASRVRVLDVNQATLKMFAAQSKEQLLAGLPLIFVPETYGTFAEQIIALWEKKAYFAAEQVEQTFTGQRIYVRVSVSPAPGYADSWEKMFVSVQDMTVQVRAQRAIQQRNQELSLLNRIIAASTTEPDENVMLESTCRDLAEVFGANRVAAFTMDDTLDTATIAAEHLTNRREKLVGVIHVPLRQNFLYRYLVTHQAPLLVENAETDIRLRDYQTVLQQYQIGAFMLCPILIDGIVVGAMGVAANAPRHFSAQDVNLLWSVSDQISSVLARLRLTAEHQRLVAAVEQIAESLIITDADTKIVYVNPAFETTTGYRRDEVLGNPVGSLYTAAEDADLWQQRWQTVALGQVWQGQITTQTKTGRQVTEDEIITPLRDHTREIVGFVSVRRDITRELDLENQYHQAQKMEAIGRLTGGVAHDFNNVLTAINGFAELMMRRMSPDEWQYSMVVNILKSGQRAAGLVRQLLVFSRKQTANPQVVEVNAVVTDMQKMLQRVIGEHIEITTDLNPRLKCIKSDLTQLEQVIVNLAVNARDAMPDGGKLHIKTINQMITAGHIHRGLDIPAGEYVMLSITDDGVGMPASIREHIFEPFFTTKEKGKGTGLGLATVYGIIRQHGGFIFVESEERQGTTFNIYLPATDDVRVSAALAPTASEAIDLSGTETILVVEDEVSVRELTVRVLRQFGYTVYSAGNGVEGFAVAETHADDLELVLTDVIMPKLNGKLMAQKIRAKNPAIKILFMSGYLSDVLTPAEMKNGQVQLLEKPFTPSELLQFVRRGLDGQ